MRIAIDHDTEVGVRAGRILLGERSLEALGVVGKAPGKGDNRLVRVDDLADFDVLVTDVTDELSALVEAALEARIGCVIWTDAQEIADTYADQFLSNMQTLLVGANLGSGIAPALASHERARSTEILDVTLAWTEPGKPLRRGSAMPFPDPVGPRWAKERSHIGDERTFVAPVSDEWAAAVARVSGSSGDGVHTRLVGVSDLAVHLEALALAAGALAVARGAFSPGAQRPVAAAEDYLTLALAAGLEVAAYILD
jgi:hypothetical protein